MADTPPPLEIGISSADDGRSAGPRWALWNYRTKAWDELPPGYRPENDPLIASAVQAKLLRMGMAVDPVWHITNADGSLFAEVIVLAWHENSRATVVEIDPLRRGVLPGSTPWAVDLDVLVAGPAPKVEPAVD